MDEEQRKRTDAYDELQERFFHHAPDMLLAIDASDYTVVGSNPVLRHTLGLHSIDIAGKDVFTLFDPGCRAKAVAKFDEALKKAHTFFDRARFVAVSGRLIPVSMHLSTQTDESNDIAEIYAVCRDLSLHQDSERLQLELRLQAAQKMESLAMLASGVAHDFNNLLVTIIGNAGLAAIDLPPESPVRSKLKDIELASSRAAELTKQLMAYSSPRDRGVEVFDLSKVVKEMSHLLEIALAQKASLHYQLSDSPLFIEGDITQIRQIIMNLLTNSADAMDEKRGLIAIRTGATHVTERYLTTTLTGEGLKPGHFAYVEVADTGVGITTDQQLRMFEPFFTTKSKGHGLGLAAVLGIVRQHGGTLRVYSEPGTGTTIKVLFPIVSAQPQPENAPAKSREPNGEHILVVDDEENVCVIAQSVLRRAGFRVSVCSGGHEALATIKRPNQSFDLVLMDISMPYLSGIETLKMLLKHAPTQRVVLMSGFSKPDELPTVDYSNYAGFMEKPFEAQTLIDTVTSALDA